MFGFVLVFVWLWIGVVFKLRILCFFSLAPSLCFYLKCCVCCFFGLAPFMCVCFKCCVCCLYFARLRVGAFVLSFVFVFLSFDSVLVFLF